MIFQLNLAACPAIAGQAALKKAKPVIFRDVFILPVLGFLGIIVLWWIIALANHELMPPVGYLNSFAIRANAPTNFFMS